MSTASARILGSLTFEHYAYEMISGVEATSNKKKVGILKYNYCTLKKALEGATLQQQTTPNNRPVINVQTDPRDIPGINSLLLDVFMYFMKQKEPTGHIVALDSASNTELYTSHRFTKLSLSFVPEAMGSNPNKWALYYYLPPQGTSTGTEEKKS